MPQFQIEEPSSADVEFLEDRLYEFNAAATDIRDGRALGVFLRDEAKNIVAGAAGHTWGDTCELRQIWVAASARGRGVGRRLMAVAEAEALRRGCRQLVLSTHSFQAPEFYRKLGFEMVADLPDYPRGHSHLLFRKRLSPRRWAVRPARAEDRETLLELWERSVRATHDFLTEGDVAALRPLVAEELAGDAVGWWVLVSASQAVIGFLGFAKGTIEALFIDPDHLNQGAGKALVAHAQSLAEGALAVEVNEQNEAALRFYLALGFSVVERMATDAGGRPFPILRMTRPGPGG